ncbi:hypothetical protein D9611_007609 [Ephemerocybe angulata]|uniref:Uncharacterized protein n=1 Tax=Ephemerocybe angulata TaxID=980116 RepID=A0A8H5BXU8_9AGAR|nr:hypothetical protein D9611_007609 [Tulosesus angulatus]
MEMVQGLYASGIESIRSLLKRLTFETTIPATDRQARLYSILFQQHFLRWLSGRGHPKLLMREGAITAELYKKEKGNAVTRTLLFIRAATEYKTTRLPDELKLRITIRYPRSYEASNQPRGIIHVCDQQLEVMLNPAMKEMLHMTRSFDDETYCSRFDAWLHKLLLLDRSDFNIA